MSITYDEVQQLLGGETPVSIQCVFTQMRMDESIEMCSKDKADFVSVYLRIDNGEVVPVVDHPIVAGDMAAALKLAQGTVVDLSALLGRLPLEESGALHGN